jgi:hypothetical protein
MYGEGHSPMAASAEMIAATPVRPGQVWLKPEFCILTFADLSLKPEVADNDPMRDVPAVKDKHNRNVPLHGNFVWLIGKPLSFDFNPLFGLRLRSRGQCNDR